MRVPRRFRVQLLSLPLLWALALMHVSLRAQQAAPAAASATRSVWSGVYTDEQAKRGAGVYAQSCANCHGKALEGNLSENGPSLAGALFLSSRNGSTVGALFRRIRSTMPDDDPGSLTPQQDADVVAYILSVNNFPSAKDELPPDVEKLMQIQFEAKAKH
jgi:mono/diheme cytochrome c family protein